MTGWSWSAAHGATPATARKWLGRDLGRERLAVLMNEGADWSENEAFGHGGFGASAG